MPVGNTVDYVWRRTLGYNAAHLLGVPALRSGVQRVCVRLYARYSSDYLTGPPICDGGKWSEMGFVDSNHSLQTGTGGGVPYLSWRGFWPGYSGAKFNHPPGDPPNDGDLDWRDCLGTNWCRIETCVSGDFGAGTGEFFIEGEALGLESGIARQWPRFSLGSSGNPGTTMLVPWIWNGFRGPDSLTCPGTPDPTPEGTPPVGYVEISHGMQAEWTTDTPGLFIGAASEVEGGAAAVAPSTGIGFPSGGGISRLRDILRWFAVAYLPGHGGM